MGPRRDNFTPEEWNARRKWTEEDTEPKLDPAWKARWCTALRSGEYEQTSRFLRRGTSRDAARFCCLGVLCDISQSGTWGRNRYYGDEEEHKEDVMPACVIRLVGAKSGNPVVNYHGKAVTLATLNDHGVPFADIADIIEEQL